MTRLNDEEPGLNPVNMGTIFSGNDAIAVWEEGVKKEREGLMTDAIRCYREALKLDDGVEKVYRRKLQEEWELQKQMQALQVSETDANEDGPTNEEDNDVKEELLPCWILEMLPNDILLRIINIIVLQSGESWVNLSLTCSTFNKLSFHDQSTYRTFAKYIYKRQQYDEDAMTLNGISDCTVIETNIWAEDYAKMLVERPYIKNQGVYISTVNYLRHGSNPEGSSSLINPIHMITYYRYFRFYPNGQCLRLLTTEEPSLMIKRLDKNHLPKDSCMCRWSLSLDNNMSHVTITRSDEKYTFMEELQIKTQSHRRHHKLQWIQSLVIDKEGNESQCSLRNEKPFYFSRVKSYDPSSHKTF